RARGAAADRARLHVQGDRGTAPHLREDGGEPCLERLAQAPAFDAARARALGYRAQARVAVSRRTLTLWPEEPGRAVRGALRGRPAPSRRAYASGRAPRATR